MTLAARERVIIMGAAGRDFHNFNVLFREDPRYEVVAFTAAQIPFMDKRTYPPELAGSLYPNGIPIFSESLLEELIRKFGVRKVLLSYSDLTAEEVIDKAGKVIAAGAEFLLPSVRETMIKAQRPVIAVTASRTGAGKSTVSRRIAGILKSLGVKFVVIRHPMPYGDLKKAVVQRFASLEDLDKYNCTIEEREEYEQHLEEGNVVYAGVDYEAIIRQAEKESQVVVWDGGNNDWPFYVPDLYITVVDPTRPRDITSSYPGFVNVKLADVIVINKVNIVDSSSVEIVERAVRTINSRAIIVRASSEITSSAPHLISGRRVLVIEDGPTVTHGGLSTAAGYQAARKYGAAEIVDPRPYAVGSIKEAYVKYPHIGPVLPALGYSAQQLKDLEATINNIPAETIVLGTPSNLTRYLKINKPIVRVKYELKEVSKPDLKDIVLEFLKTIQVI
jgi:predicted GTPase